MKYYWIFKYYLLRSDDHFKAHRFNFILKKGLGILVYKILLCEFNVIGITQTTFNLMNLIQHENIPERAIQVLSVLLEISAA